MDPLKRIENELKKCVKCGACRAHCPAFATFQREPAVARGKVALAQHLQKGDIALDDQTYLAMSKCLLCGSCVEKCPNDVQTDEIVMAAREALAQQRGLTTFHQAVGRVIGNRKLMNFGAFAARFLGPLFPQSACNIGLRLRFPLPFIGNKRHIPKISGKPFLDRHAEVIPGEPGKPRVVYFVGCMTNFVYTDVGEAALALFRHLGCTVIIPKDQQCCGLPGMSGGDLATVRGLAEKNLAALERYEADYITTACATCGGALHKFYPAVIGKRHPELLARCKALAEKTVDASVLLQKLGLDPPQPAPVRNSALPTTIPAISVPVILCEQPRELLQSSPGVEPWKWKGPINVVAWGAPSTSTTMMHRWTSMLQKRQLSRIRVQKRW